MINNSQFLPFQAGSQPPQALKNGEKHLMAQHDLSTVSARSQHRISTKISTMVLIRVWPTAQPQRWIAYPTEERRTEEPTTHCADHSHDKGLGGETENRSGQNRWMNRKRTRKQCSKHHGARRLLHNDSPPSVR